MARSTTTLDEDISVSSKKTQANAAPLGRYHHNSIKNFKLSEKIFQVSFLKFDNFSFKKKKNRKR